MSITEWSAAFAGESDFSTAFGDADAYGIMGREDVYLSTRWTAPDPANPNYQALKLFTNYDGAKHVRFDFGFGDPQCQSRSVQRVCGDSPGGATTTIMVLNKDPVNSAQTTFTLTDLRRRR